MVGFLKNHKKAASKKNTKGSVPDDSSFCLLKAAKKLFSKQGYDGVTVRDLADEAQVNLSLVSYHFGGKEGLYRKCLEEFGMARLASAERLLTPPENPEEMKLRFSLFVEEFLQNYKNDPEMVRMISRECEAELPIVADIFQNTFLKVFIRVKEFLSVGQEKGFVASDLDPQFITMQVMGMMAHAIRMDPIATKYMKKSLLDDTHRKKFGQSLVRIVFEGILSKGEVAHA